MEEVDINAPSEILLPQEEAPREPIELNMLPETDTAQAKPTYVEDHKSHIAPLRTFSSDLADAIKTKGGSVVRIAIEEDEKRRKQEEEQSITSKKNIVFIVAGFILIIGAIGLVIGEYQHKKNASVVVPQQVEQPSSIVTSDTADTIDATGMQPTDLLAAIAKIQSAALQSGMVDNIVITKTAGSTVTRIPASEFLPGIATHAPASLLAALSPEYMLGVYSYDQNNTFLILRGTEHDFLVSGMLAWEPTLFADMTTLLGIDTTGMTPVQIQNAKFTDAVIANYDTEAVLDGSGKPIFFYSFIDQDTILLATDPKVLTEVVRRFN